MKPKLRIYQRDGCHLCEVAYEQLRNLQAEYPFELEQIDIEASDELHRRYLARIPVIALGGEELYDFSIDLADLKSRLLAASAR